MFFSSCLKFYTLHEANELFILLIFLIYQFVKLIKEISNFKSDNRLANDDYLAVKLDTNSKTYPIFKSALTKNNENNNRMMNTTISNHTTHLFMNFYCESVRFKIICLFCKCFSLLNHSNFN